MSDSERDDEDSKFIETNSFLQSLKTDLDSDRKLNYKIVAMRLNNRFNISWKLFKVILLNYVPSP
jgi:hypothetical protein